MKKIEPVVVQTSEIINSGIEFDRGRNPIYILSFTCLKNNLLKGF